MRARTGEQEQESKTGAQQQDTKAGEQENLAGG
jgi:hypothetical protein